MLSKYFTNFFKNCSCISVELFTTLDMFTRIYGLNVFIIWAFYKQIKDLEFESMSNWYIILISASIIIGFFNVWHLKTWLKIQENKLSPEQSSKLSFKFTSISVFFISFIGLFAFLRNKGSEGGGEYIIFISFLISTAVFLLEKLFRTQSKLNEDIINDSPLFIHKTPNYIISHRADSRYMGYLIISSQQKVTEVSELSHEALSELGSVLAWTEKLLITTYSPYKVIMAKLGFSQNHNLHFHMIPVSTALLEEIKEQSEYINNEPDGKDALLFVSRNYCERPLNSDEKLGQNKEMMILKENAVKQKI